ncbi:MAG: mechanosensitive ion channel [Gammaproteobacteria bacterium]
MNGELNLDYEVLLQHYAVPWGTKLLLALLILFVGVWVSRRIVKLVGRMMVRSGLDEMLIGFISSLVNALLLVVVVIAALAQLGIQTTSLIAVLGAAGLAVGLALQNSLANFAAGVLLLIFKPFKAGDFVEVAGVTGTVENIRVFSSVLRTPDNREITVPNGKIYGDIITNFTARDTRRIDLVVGISYESDLRKAIEILQDLMASDTRVLADPAPTTGVLELADSSVNLFLRPWVASSDFWAVRCDFLERIKQRFDESGIVIPYPQMDVHLQSGAETAS